VLSFAKQERKQNGAHTWWWWVLVAGKDATKAGEGTDKNPGTSA
jgi:hypothetical protein